MVAGGGEDRNARCYPYIVLRQQFPSTAPAAADKCTRTIMQQLRDASMLWLQTLQGDAFTMRLSAVQLPNKAHKAGLGR